MLFVLIPDVDVYRLLRMDAPLKMYPLLALVRVFELSLPSYKTDSFCVRSSKTRKLQVHPLLNFLIIPD